MSEKRHTFEAQIEEGRGGGAFVRVPLDVERLFGTRGRVPIVASIDGVSYRGSIAPMGGAHVLGIVKSIRTAIGKDVGDSVHFSFQRDLEERTVEVPEALRKALDASKSAREFFTDLSYTQRKEYARWIATAKRAETRARRVQQAIEKLEKRERL